MKDRTPVDLRGNTPAGPSTQSDTVSLAQLRPEARYLEDVVRLYVVRREVGHVVGVIQRLRGWRLVTLSLL